jgi:hypothetical protein
MRSFASINN